jgi:rare lipoprotein A
VNDRGPRTPGRIIDLSYAAAETLGSVQAGLIPVRVRVVSLPNP